jgi:hypothetical protein
MNEKTMETQRPITSKSATIVKTPQEKARERELQFSEILSSGIDTSIHSKTDWKGDKKPVQVSCPNGSKKIELEVYEHSTMTRWTWAAINLPMNILTMDERGAKASVSRFSVSLNGNEYAIGLVGDDRRVSYDCIKTLVEIECFGKSLNGKTRECATRL